MPKLGDFWVYWVIDDGKLPITSGQNPNLDYTQAWGFDHGGSNWLTGISTGGKSLIIDGRRLRSMNQGYCRLVAKYKEGKCRDATRDAQLGETPRPHSLKFRVSTHWDANLDRIQRKRNNQMRDAINKAARFIINQCLADGVGNLVIGWNQGQKNGINMGKQNNQNFAPIPTGRLIERLKQLCEEYGIVFTTTEESYTSKASFLDDDFLPTHGEKPEGWKPSGERVKRGLYRTRQGWLVNADCNGAANILKKVATQLGITALTEVGRGSLTLPQRINLFTRLNREFRRVAECGFNPLSNMT